MNLKEFCRGHQSGCAPAKTVENSHHFRHGCHCNFCRRNCPNNRPNGNTGYYPFQWNCIHHEQCGDNGNEHTHCRKEITLPGRIYFSQPFNTYDKQDGRNNISDKNQILFHCVQTYFFLNIFNIRSVTR